MSKKVGCFTIGCLVLVGLVVVLVSIGGVVVFIAKDRAANPQVTTSTLEPELPTVEIGGEAAEIDPGTAGRVVLDLRQAGFFVEPAAAGEPLRVEASFDERYGTLEESLETADDGSWVYRVDFRRSGSMLMGVMSQVFGGPQPEVRVLIPPDLPHFLELSVEDGGAEVELGGLWLTGLDAEVSRGGMVLEISEPLRQPIAEMSLSGGMGGLVASELGNASPARLQVDYQMGGVEVDLRGAWQTDGVVDVEVSMGGGRVKLPDNVTVRGVETARPRVVTGEGLEAALPVVTVTVTGKDVEIDG